MEQMREQAEHVGAALLVDHITSVDLSRRPFHLHGDSGNSYTCDALIIATGAQAKWLGLPGRTALPRLRRVGLRHLRRLLLPQQERRRDRRRQHRRRGGALPHPLRRQGHPDPPPGFVPGGEDHAAPAVRQRQDRGDLGHRRRRRDRRRRAAAVAQGPQAPERQDRNDQRSDGRRAVRGHRPRAGHRLPRRPAPA